MSSNIDAAKIHAAAATRDYNITPQNRLQNCRKSRWTFSLIR